MDILWIPLAIILEVASNVPAWFVVAVILSWTCIRIMSIYHEGKSRMMRTLESIDSKLSNLEKVTKDLSHIRHNPFRHWEK